MTPLETVIAKLAAAGCNPRQSTGRLQYHARCPNTTAHRHGDRNPSLSVAQGDDGRALIHCATGCTIETITQTLGLTIIDLYPDREPANQRPHITATYPYVDNDGTLLFQVVRLTPKSFRQRQPDGNGGWRWGLDGITNRPLYRLPAVTHAVHHGETIWIVEGEKDADALTRAGHTATCNLGGAGPTKWRPEHTAALTGAQLVEIVADDDPPGREHALHIAQQLRPHVAEIRLWLPHPGCKDISEHLGQHRTLAELRPLPTTPEPDPDPQPEPNRLRANLLIGDEILRIPPVQWIVDQVIQTDGLTVIYGPPKSFKTFVALDLALHIANGYRWRQRPTRQTRVLYVAAEGAPGVGTRAKAWTRYHRGNLHNMAWIKVPPDLFNDDTETSDITEIAAELEVGLIVIDTLARSIAGAEENSAKDMGLVIGRVDRIKEHTGSAIILVHHTGKDASRGMRGSNALQGAVDTSLEIVGDEHAVNARIVDQKNADADAAWWWKPTREHPSLVLTPTAGETTSDDVRDVNLLRQLQLMDDGYGVASGVWETAAVEREICGHSAFHTLKKSFVERGLAERVSDRKNSPWRVAAAGHEMLRNAAT